MTNLFRLDATLAALDAAAESIARAREQVLAALEATAPAKPTSYKDISGKLSEHGVQTAHAMFARGDGPSEVSRALDISVPAAVYRRQRWLALGGLRFLDTSESAGA